MDSRFPWSVSALRAAFDSHVTTSRAVVEQGLARSRAADGKLGAYLFVDEAGALAQADASDERRARGQVLSALDGVPVAIKDNIVEEGRPATAGSRILDGWTSPYDATVVARLKAAGAVLVGRTNMDEFGMGSSTEKSAYKACRNPWARACIPGGSSGGSAAAVAAGYVCAALGSDTGGSIRQPAGMCGVVGFKPSWGRVSRFGLIAFASSLDVIGPLATDVESAAALLDVMAGPDPRDATCATTPMPNLREVAQTARAAGLTVGIPRSLLKRGLHPDVAHATQEAEEAYARVGVQIVDVDLPRITEAVPTYYVLCAAEASSNLARFDGVRYGPRRGEESGVARMLEDTRGLFGPEVKRRIVLGSWVLSAGYYEAYTHKAQQVRRIVADDLARALASCDVLLFPTSPEPAWPLGDKGGDPLSMYLADIFTVPASLAGLPAVSLNAGSSGNLPVGVQLVGRAFEEHTVTRAAAVLERALDLPRSLPTDIEAHGA